MKSRILILFSLVVLVAACGKKDDKNASSPDQYPPVVGPYEIPPTIDNGHGRQENTRALSVRRFINRKEALSEVMSSNGTIGSVQSAYLSVKGSRKNKVSYTLRFRVSGVNYLEKYSGTMFAMNLSQLSYLPLRNFNLSFNGDLAYITPFELYSGETCANVYVNPVPPRNHALSFIVCEDLKFRDYDRRYRR